jgi:hypothetical protein
MSTELEIKHVPNPHVHNTEEALVPSFELALVENLDGDDRGFPDHTTNRSDD